jgi:ribonuclease HI
MLDAERMLFMPDCSMRATDPHFLLFSAAFGAAETAPLWRFVLQPVGSDSSLAAADAEENAPPSRLELLAVVRGLEALEQPSRVTLLTGSRYVIRGIRRGLSQWRERRWRWERFGRLVPIRDDDLWRRVDRAMQFHQVECCEWRGEELVAASPCGGAGLAKTCKGSAESPAAEAALPVGAAEREAAVETVNESPADEPALVIVARTASRRNVHRKATNGAWATALKRLRQGVLAQIAMIRAPAFTRAA